MSNQVSLAWAVPVDYTQLGARLEAYVETRAAVTTFKACILHTTIRSMSNLPPELVGSVIDALKDIIYLQKIDMWNIERRCMEQECNTRSHLAMGNHISPHLLGLFNPDVSDDEDDDFSLNEMHYVAVEEHPAKITRAIGDKPVKNFARCKEIFFKDFDIRPYFTVLQEHEDNEYPQFLFAEITAYLTSPVVRSAVKSKPGPNNASFTVQQVVDPAAIIQGASANVDQRFKQAIKALRLDAPHTQLTVVDKYVRCHCCDRYRYNSEDDDDHDDEISEISGPSIATEVGLYEDNASPGRNIKIPDGEHEASKDNDLSMGAMGHDGAGTHGPSVPKPQQPTKYRTYCIDCGREACRGGYEAQKPELMLLGSGELVAYSADY